MTNLQTQNLSTKGSKDPVKKEIMQHHANVYSSHSSSSLPKGFTDTYSHIHSLRKGKYFLDATPKLILTQASKALLWLSC